MLRLYAACRPTHDIRKIKAHQDIHRQISAEEADCLLGNRVADTFANQAVHSLLPEFASDLKQHAMRTQQMQDMFSLVLHYILQT